MCGKVAEVIAPKQLRDQLREEAQGLTDILI